MQCGQFRIHRRHAAIQRLYMRGHLLEHRPGGGGDHGVGGQRDQQGCDVGGSLCRYDAELGCMATQGVDCLGALPNQHLAMFQDDAIGLLSDCLDGDRAHGRP